MQTIGFHVLCDFIIPTFVLLEFLHFLVFASEILNFVPTNIIILYGYMSFLYNSIVNGSPDGKKQVLAINIKYFVNLLVVTW